MKKFIILSFVLISFAASAQRVILTSQDKETLRTNQAFKTEVKFAVLSQAQYWVALDQTGASTQASRERWAKSRLLSSRIVAVPADSDSEEWVLYFLMLVKNTPVRTSGGNFDAAETISYMIAQGIFESLADQAFDQKIKAITF